MKYPESQWPKTENIRQDQKNYNQHEMKQFNLIIMKRQKNEALSNIENFSIWMRLIRSTSWVLKFIQRIKKDKRHNENYLLSSHLRRAEILWWKDVQQQYFSEEIRCLRKKVEIDKTSKLFLDDEDVLRMNSRISLASVADEDMKNPIILHPEHRFTKLLVEHTHRKCSHLGAEYVLNEIKQRYWILNARVLIKKLTRNCLFCKKRRGNPTIPILGDLPESRLAAYKLPFTYTGMDYFGPLEVTIGRRREKRYGVIFTCLTTRAVHIEVAHSLSTNSTIMAIQRMIAQRGRPAHLYSDNGTNLRGAERELKKNLEELDKTRIVDELTNKNII